MHRVALLIGGNLGDRHALIEQATELIRQRIGSVVALSRVYETEPWGDFETENGEHSGMPSARSTTENFLNRALLVETPLLPHDVLREAQAIETALGRERKLSTPHAPLPTPHAPLPTPHYPLSTRKYHSRTMDVDIIFYDDAVVDTPDLTIPHPCAQLRRFVLEPLAEIMPDYHHPLLMATVADLLARLQVG